MAAIRANCTIRGGQLTDDGLCTCDLSGGELCKQVRIGALFVSVITRPLCFAL